MGDEKGLNERIRHLRKEYAGIPLEKDRMPEQPLTQLERWLDEAIAADVMEPNAMTLATADQSARPSARIVLVRELTENGPVFFTNYESRKGKELEMNPRACGNFFWPELQRQVRMEGKAERIEEGGSDEYFSSRPLKSRIGAWASDQSRVVPSRKDLERKVREMEERFKDEEPPRPDHWGGYCIRVDRVEFWQGRPDRLHDRIEFVKEGDAEWVKQRLNP